MKHPQMQSYFISFRNMFKLGCKDVPQKIATNENIVMFVCWLFHTSLLYMLNHDVVDLTHKHLQ